jgi:hypothetical protein
LEELNQDLSDYIDDFAENNLSEDENDFVPETWSEKIVFYLKSQEMKTRMKWLLSQSLLLLINFGQMKLVIVSFSLSLSFSYVC